MKWITTVSCGLIVLSLFDLIPALGAADDILIADFEGSDYGGWVATGEAFGPGPARGTLPGQMPVSGFQGQGLVNTFFKGDKSIGTLTSLPFKIERKYINFLIGGGGYAEQTCLNLLRGGTIVRTATGPNRHSGGSEKLEAQAWDVSALMGDEVVLQIVDKATGGWGHINVDQIRQSDQKAGLAFSEQHRELKLSQRYLNLPVKNGAAKRRMSLIVKNEKVREFEIEAADRAPDFWVFLDLEPFRGQDAVLSVDRLPEDSLALRAVELSDQIKGGEDLYREKNRPQFHFTSRRGWNNDPNGLVYYGGEYHLFYQHNPYGREWGNMHWGHAISRDLVHWTELPIALYPRRFGDWAFSGSAWVDWPNSGGFKTGESDVLVAAYTSTGRGECIVYSNDRGRTWTEYSGNPVVKHEGRDPKVIWHEPSRRWVMAVYHEVPEGGKTKQTIAFYSSVNLKEWRYESLIDGFFECPDLFALPIDGNPARQKWVLQAADGDYIIGEFDGHAFVKESGKHKGNHGNCFYAAQTYSDIPARDGRRIQIGWGRVSLPGMPFNQMMTFPCELTLRTGADGMRMHAEPVREIEALHVRKSEWKDLELKPGENPLAAVKGELFDIRLRCVPGQTRQVKLKIGTTTVSYDVTRQELSCGDRRAPLSLVEGKLDLQLLVDRASIEIFGNRGRVYLPMAVVPEGQNRSLELSAELAPIVLETLVVHELKSAWRSP